MMGKTKRNETAQALYGQQNKLLHQAFYMVGMSYEANKTYWKNSISRLVKRNIEGLSDLSLGERSTVLSHLSKTCSGKIYNPHVPRHWNAWQKGDPEPKGKIGHRPMHVPKFKQPRVRKIHAILADMKLPWSYVDKIARERFRVQFVEWLDSDDLQTVVQMMVVHQKRNGGPKNYGKKQRTEVNDAG